MSDKKTPAGTPSGAAPTSGAFEQEFEKFLRDEATPAGAIYRKLPHAEPDAQLDARVRALAHGALREPASSTAATASVASERTTRRWIPTFASAAVLVLAAGIAWRMGPQNWTQKDAARSAVVDAASPPSAAPTAATMASPSVGQPGPQSQAAAPAGDNTRAAVTGATEASRESTANAPVPFPAAKAPPHMTPPPGSGSAPASPALAELRKAEDARNTEAAALESRMAGSRAAGQAAPAREKSARADVVAAHTEMQQAATVGAASAPSTSAPARTGAGVPAANGTVAGVAAMPEPPKPAAVEDRNYAPKAKALMPPPPVPPPPVVAAEPTPAQTVVATPAPQEAPADALQRDEAEVKKQSRQRETEKADRSSFADAAKERAPAAPPPPPPPPPSGFAPEPTAAAAAPALKPGTTARADMDREVQKQPYPDRITTPDGLAQVTIPIRPTGAQVAAWPPPNCHAIGTVTASGTGVDAQTWNYPPDVPGSVHLRIVIVETYLNTESREGALKAYADFRHCYPDDNWPPSLLRQLGTR